MFTFHPRGLAAVIGSLLAALLPLEASAHAIAGNRIFPATLAIDDPGVADELALPTFTYLPVNPDGVGEYDFAASYAKRITPNLALSVGETFTTLKPGGSGFQNLGLGLKYLGFVDGPHEFMASIGLDVDVGGTGAAQVGADRFSTLSPTFYFGKGFGDLPTTMNPWRPFAITGQIGSGIPTDARTTTVSSDPATGLPFYETSPNATTLDWGFTLQYSLPYMNANVSAVGGPEFLKHLVPIVEAAFSTPIANTTLGQRETTGAIQPGVVYMADSWQIALEAVVPVNNASGKNVGVVAELHFFLDDIFPDSIGKPLFP